MIDKLTKGLKAVKTFAGYRAKARGRAFRFNLFCNAEKAKHKKGFPLQSLTRIQTARKQTTSIGILLAL